MIPLDPEEIIAAGCGETLRRVGIAMSTLFLGSLFSLGAFIFTSLLSIGLDFVLPSVTAVIELEFDAAFFFLLPIWAFGSLTAILSFPNLIIALIYFARVEEPTALRYLIHAAIHQFATSCAVTLWFLDGDLILGVALWIFHLIFLALLVFAVFALKNRFRSNHEEHLMAVASQNELRKRELASKVHIPPPPTGTPSPKAHPLSSKEDE